MSNLNLVSVPFKPLVKGISKYERIEGYGYRICYIFDSGSLVTVENMVYLINPLLRDI